MKQFFKTFFFLLILTGPVAFDGFTQGYYVVFEGMQARLYLGYVNPVRFYIRNPTDTIPYNFHAQAEGAIIDYDNQGSMLIKPLLKKGTIRFFAERGGMIFNVKGVFQFEAVEPPPLTDGTFILMMGITKEDPKTKIKNPKKFVVPANQPVRNSNLEIGGIPLRELRNDEQNMVRVLIMKREGVNGVPQTGDIQVTSADARIRRIDANTFSITPLPSLRKCKLSITLDGEKVTDEWMDVRRVAK